MGVATRSEVGLPVGTVTFLLTDVAESTRLWETDRTAMARAITRHYEIIDDLVARHGGVRPLEQGEGDSTVAAFARASDAVAAALGMQRALASEPWGTATIRVRIGLHTGEAQLRDDVNYVGPAVARCARLRSLGHGGQILLSRTTADVVADALPDYVTLLDLGEHRLRDMSRPEHVFQLCHPDVEADFPALKSVARAARSLPVQLTSFVGREAEIAELRALMTDNRFVTLIGAGGCGKTRLGLEVVTGMFERFDNGVHWVDLAPLAEPDLVPSAVAGVLGVHEVALQDMTETITIHLQGKRLLVVLDNCEHLAGASASLCDRLLRACEGVRSWPPAENRSGRRARRPGTCPRSRFRASPIPTCRAQNRSGCSSTAQPRPDRASESRTPMPKRSPRPAAVWMGSRWRSSSLPRAHARSRPSRSWTGSKTASHS